MPENGSLYFTDGRARAATVSQVVTDRVITHSPSEDAVFDALASHVHSSLDAADGTPQNALVVDNSGYVGIGTTAPVWPLEIDSMNSTTSTGITVNTFENGSGIVGAGLRLSTTRGSMAAPTNLLTNDSLGGVFASGFWTGKATTGFQYGDARANINFGAAENWTGPGANGAYMNFFTTSIGSNVNAERMRISASGNVGIGTSSPNGKIHVVRAAAEYGPVAQFSGEDFSAVDPATRLQIQDATGGVAWFMSAMNDGKFTVHQGSTGDRITIDNTNGNVGIGSGTPRAKLDVAGDAKIGNSSATCNATTEGSLRYNSSSKIMEFCNATAWTAVASGSARVLIDEVVVSSAVAAVDLLGMTSAYDRYVVEFDGVRGATDSQHLDMRVSSDGGSTWKSNAAYDWVWLGNTSSSPGAGAGGAQNDTKFVLTSTAGGYMMSNVAGEIFEGQLTIHGPANTTIKHIFTGQGALRTDGAASVTQFIVSGGYATLGAFDSLRFFMSSGNIATGTFRLWGIPKS